MERFEGVGTKLGVSEGKHLKHLSLSLSSFWKLELLIVKIGFIWELTMLAGAGCFAAFVSVIFVLTVSLFLEFGGRQYN